MPDANPQEAYFITKQIITNLYDAARHVQYYRQLQIILHSDPVYLDIYKPFNRNIF